MCIIPRVTSLVNFIYDSYKGLCSNVFPKDILYVYVPALSYTGNCPFCIKDHTGSSFCRISELWKNFIPFPVERCCSWDILWLCCKLIVVKIIIWVTFHSIKVANKTHFVFGRMEITGIQQDWPQSSLLLPQRGFKLLGSFLLRLEWVCPWAIVALNLAFLPTGLPHINFSLEKGGGQRN